MKPSRLLNFIRDTCFFFEWITPVCAVVMLLVSWVGFAHDLYVHPPEVQHAGLPFYGFEFEVFPPVSLAPVSYHGVKTESLWVSHFRAELMAGEPGTPSKIIAFMHWGAVSRFFLMLLTATIFSLLRRLFDRVKKGDAFTMKSVGLVRLMGWSFFAYLAFQTVYENLFAWIVSKDLSLSELTTGFRSAGTGEPVRFVLLNHHLNLDLTAAFFGLFALALAEVIRQGLLLKEENDLTV